MSDNSTPPSAPMQVMQHLLNKISQSSVAKIEELIGESPAAWEGVAILAVTMSKSLQTMPEGVEVPTLNEVTTRAIVSALLTHPMVEAACDSIADRKGLLK